MSKRFHDTEIWHEDWFIALPKDYRDFWLYLKDDCDHAGIWRPKIAGFNKLYDCKVSLQEGLKLFNQDRNGDKRVIVLKNGRWFLVGFIPFQYGLVLNLASRTHFSVYRLLQENEVNLTSIRPLVEVIDRVKDKDKDKDKDILDSKKGDSKGEVGVVKKLTPSQEFIKCFSLTYEAATGQPFKTEAKHFIILTKLIKDYGLPATIEKTKIFARLCADKSVWFTEDGWADFTIEKLSSRWNNIIPKLTKEEEEKAKFEKQRKEDKERNERLKNTIK